MQAQDIVVVSVDAGASTSTGKKGNTMWRAAKELYTEPGGGGGWRVFWRGLVPTIVRAVPVNMAVFGTFETVVWAFS